MTLTGHRAAMSDHGSAWASLLAGDPDPDEVIREVDEEEDRETRRAVGDPVGPGVRPRHGSPEPDLPTRCGDPCGRRAALN